MMSTYINKPLADLNLSRLKSFNNLYRSAIRNQINYEKHNLTEKADRGRYNIWDIIADFSQDIIYNNMVLGNVDKIYLGKMLNAFINNPDITGSSIGLEYYCLKQIIRFPVFKSSAKMGWVYEKISDTLNYYSTNGFAKRTAMMFARNVRKMEIVKKTFNSSCYYRTFWNNVFNCYSLGSRSLNEELNQNEMLNMLGIKINSADDLNTCIEVLPDSEDEYLLADLDGQSDISASGANIDLDIVIENDRKQFAAGTGDSPVESESENGVVEDITEDPEAWDD